MVNKKYLRYCILYESAGRKPKRCQKYFYRVHYQSSFPASMQKVRLELAKEVKKFYEGNSLPKMNLILNVHQIQNPETV